MTLDIGAIPGLQQLWSETRGHPDISVAILDGPVDQTHPSLLSANLTRLGTMVSDLAHQRPAAQHGTHITSIIFGQHNGQVRGMAPKCRGLIVPIFDEREKGSIAPCSQLDLARAILQAVQAGAHIINISGGENSPSGTAHPILADAVRKCAAQGVLVVSAAGNESCNCLHVPGGLPSVLSVGAMNSQGEPLEFSNWGEGYQGQGILAPGEHIPGASPGGGIVANTGTSYAAAIVSGIAALLLSLQLKMGQRPDPEAVRVALLGSAVGCHDQPAPDCRRLLAGRLNVKGAMAKIEEGGSMMTDSVEVADTREAYATADGERHFAESGVGAQVVAARSQGSRTVEVPGYSQVERSTTYRSPEKPSASSAVIPAQVSESGCSGDSSAAGTSGGSTSLQLVYALGVLGFDFGTEARRDSIAQHMNGNPGDPSQLLAYLEESPWDAESIVWTLNLDATPIYAILPMGVFANEGYQRLRQFLREQLTEGVERISLPGIVVGKTRLMSGQVVPVVRPELRCMYSWTTAALVGAARGEAAEKGEDNAKKRAGVTNFLERIYHELRNLGLTSQERAINYSATNAFNVNHIFQGALEAGMELDTIEVERSPICRPGLDCWDVKLMFFDPENMLRSRRVHRFTVDVSDVCPVTVGDVRSWSVR